MPRSKWQGGLRRRLTLVRTYHSCQTRGIAMRRPVPVAIIALSVLIQIAFLRGWMTDKVSSTPHKADEQLQIAADDTGRERYADQLTKRFSKNWRTVTFHVSGPENTTLHMDDVLVNRLFIDDLVRDGKLVDEARAMGFCHLNFMDGFGNTWNHNIRSRN
jgi:hypothetical protein